MKYFLNLLNCVYFCSSCDSYDYHLHMRAFTFPCFKHFFESDNSNKEK